jgi:hypothetical protein
MYPQSMLLLIFFAFASQSPVDFQAEWTRFPLRFDCISSAVFGRWQFSDSIN